MVIALLLNGRDRNARRQRCQFIIAWRIEGRNQFPQAEFA